MYIGCLLNLKNNSNNKVIKMNEVEDDTRLMEKIKEMITEGKIDAVVDKIAIYLNLSTEENYI